MTPRPPFVMKASRSAVLRCDGKFVVSGRASFVWETFLLRRAAGVPGVYEISRGRQGGVGAPWHTLSWTIDDAETALSSWGIFGPRRLARMRKLRASRTGRGLPVS